MLSDNIRTIRKNRGFTQEELAARLHVTRQTISKWEKGYSVPDADLLSRMAEVLEVPVAELLGAPSQPVSDPDPIVEQLARLNEQLAIKNRRAARIWKTVAIMLVVLLLVPVILAVLFGAVRDTGLGADTDAAGSTEWACTMDGKEYFYKVYYQRDYFITARAGHTFLVESAGLEDYDDARVLEEKLTEWVTAQGGTVAIWDQEGLTLE